MSRSLYKGPYVDPKLMKKKEAEIAAASAAKTAATDTAGGKSGAPAKK